LDRWIRKGDMKRRIWLIAMLAVVSGAGLLAVIRAEPSPLPSALPDPSAAAMAPGHAADSAVVPADPIVWGGVAWQNVPDPFPEGDARPLRIDGLTAGNGAVVGWGRVATPGRNQFNDMGAVFVSSDGRRWRAIALDDGVPPADTSEPNGVAIGPLGMLAFGGVCCGIEERALWRSADGLNWTRVPLGAGFNQRVGTMLRVVGLKTGWVAVGSQGDQAVIWTSLDGSDWQPVDPAVAGLGKGSVSDVALTADGLVAVGTVDDAAGTHDGAIWISKDGVQWTRTAEADPALIGPDETELWRVVPFARGLFVVGNFGSHEDRVECERALGDVASLEAAPPPETAFSCGWGQEHHWLSRDGSAWVRLPPLDPLPGQPPKPGRRPIEFRLVTAGGPGLVNLAEDSIPPDGDSGIWVSADGIAWQRVDPPFPGPGGSIQSGFVIIGREIVTVGEKAGMGQGVEVSVGRVP
jgi:hypothetical protein